MPKRKLFYKIYLWFWLATIAVAVSIVLFDRLTHTGPYFSHLKHSVASVLAMYGQTAAEERLHGDADSLARVTQQLRERASINAYLLDENDQEAQGRALPQGGLELARLARHSKEVELASAGESALLALTIKAGEGRHFVVLGEIMPHRRGSQGGSNRLLALKVAILLLVSGGVCYCLALYLTTPILRIREAARLFAAGHLDVRIGPGVSRRQDELAELATEFDGMADRLAALMDAQRQLMGDISHELRSPLARLGVALELARRQAGPQAAKSLDRIETEAHLLNELIGQVLTLTRLETGLGPEASQEARLDELLAGIAADAAFEAQGSGREVAVLESTPCVITVQEGLMRRAIENVVRNALTHTAPGSQVEISLRQAPLHGASFAEISVRDHGPGVPEEELANIFRPFYRVSGARERQTGGSGLGLAIAERAIRLHHGSVWAVNAPGGGLQVVILLPLGAALA